MIYFDDYYYDTREYYINLISIIVTAMTLVTGNRGRAGSGLAPLVYSLAHGAASQLLHLNLG